MATLTIRNLDDDVRDALRVRAAKNGRSMEAEVRAILERQTLQTELTVYERLKAIHDRFQEDGGVELEIPPRDPPRAPVVFGE